ncbi:hypothetical protein C5C11_05090 [Rathayibacter rathayi]|nr:hypothetical protein C5C11_05090 [Rathayibacter rathayi]
MPPVPVDGHFQFRVGDVQPPSSFSEDGEEIRELAGGFLLTGSRADFQSLLNQLRVERPHELVVVEGSAHV